ncbi:Non-repetitive/WGA-negative nucleoporin C-terminal-domain-containing protein [Xylariaceae sp. FL0255]|nr:Non-repetitive/WGA-negative nucleoporin C-terminal-domain-containing protein [Xylariaceae sp. FL0255]
MFAPAQAVAKENGTATPMTTRGRRRQRPLSSDSSLPQPKSKRMRSDRPQINDQTFVDPIAAPPETYEVKAAQPSARDVKQDGIEAPTTPRHQLSVRSKKSRTGDRLNKGDGSTVLSINNAFEVRKLPALPDRIRLDATSRQHASLDHATGCALSITHTHAVVWPYAAAAALPESFTFTLPYPSKHSTDPLPLGSLVSPSASSVEPGLVVVMPTSGKVTYWESISSAAALDFMRQQRTGVEDTIPGMFSSETVIQMVNAEAAAGFVLAFSSGRVAYLSVRDGHGRPKISVQFLRTNSGSSSGGFFGSIRHALTHTSLQGDIAAVRAERSSNSGECTVVAATSKGRLNSWKVHRGGHHDLLTEVDARNAIYEALQQADKSVGKFPAESFKILDFCFVPKGMPAKYTEMSQLRPAQSSDDRQYLLLLTSLDDKNTCRYNLVEVIIPNGASAESPIETGMVRAISSYSKLPNPHAIAPPRLYIPRPAVIAFIVFDHSAIIASIGQPPDSPESQIMQDNHLLPSAFEDIVDLRHDASIEVVGSGFEEPHIRDDDDVRPARIKTKNPTAVLFVRGAGTIRITISDYERFASDKPPMVTPKSKLEQAVFFGVKEDNPLLFDIQHNIRFSDEDYGAAALELSEAILTSSGPHLASMAARIETNIKDRVRYLAKMMFQIKSLGVQLSRATKWQLLWNAEKMHVASVLWRKHEEFLHMRPTDAKKTIIAEIVDFIRAEEKSRPDPEKGETDDLRHWFIHDCDRMELFIAWAYEVIKYNTKAKLDLASVSRLIYEASDLYNCAIRDAFTFREEHLDLYGLGTEKLDNGVLESNYAGLPVPWTSNQFVANNLKRQVELVTEWLRQETASPVEAHAVYAEKTRDILPELTEVYLSVLQELARSNLASDDPKQVSNGQKFQNVYLEDRHAKVVLLSLSEKWEAAIKLAETHRSLPALAEILTREIDVLRDEIAARHATADQLERAESRMAEKEEKVRECFGKYGEDFAFPFYEYLFTTYGVDALLEYDGDKKFKTMFLRTKPELAKISWINDIVGEEDIDHAADTLLDLGLSREQQVWNKKIELSLGKLARMAESSRPSTQASMSAQELTISGTAEDARVDAIDRELTIIEIQNEFYDTQIRPIISVSLDESSGLALVQETFALKVPKKYKILAQIFEDALKRLLNHEALDPLTLIDLLTMVTLPAETKEVMADQFFLAMEVAFNGLSGAERVSAERLIWRRCFLREDWTVINNTTMKDDEETLNVLGQTDLFQFYCTLYVNQRNSQASVTSRRLSPSEALGVYTETVDRRFTSMEKSYREKILEVMRWEDANLRKHIEKHRLNEWAKETRKLAEHAIDQQTDAATEAQSPNRTPLANGSRA